MNVFKEGVDISSKNIVIFVPIFIVMILKFILSLFFKLRILSLGFTPGFAISRIRMYLQEMVHSSSLPFFSGWLIISIFFFIITIIAHVATIGMANEAAEKNSVSLAGAINTVRSRIAPYLLVVLIINIISIVGLIFYAIPGFIAVFFLMFTPVAIVVDNMGAVSAIKRSVTLVRQNIKDTLVFFIAIILVTAGFIIVSMVVGLVPFISHLTGLILMGVLSSYTAVVTVKFYKNLTNNAADEDKESNS